MQAKVTQIKAEFSKVAPVIREKYGDWLDNFDIEEILNAEKENAICDKCKGFPCQKRANKNFRRVIRVLEDLKYIRVASTPCKYTLRERKQKKLKRNFNRCKIPPKYVGKSFESYEVTRDNETAVEWAKYVVENPSQGLMLYGIPGCGKTFLAAIVAQELLKREKTVIFGDVPSILDTLKSTFNSENEQQTLDKLMDELEAVDVLVLDDIGTEYPTSWAAERLYIIINNRYNAGKPIIATSNYGAEDLIKRFKLEQITGRRIISRLSEMCKTIEIRGDDRRMRR